MTTGLFSATDSANEPLLRRVGPTDHGLLEQYSSYTLENKGSVARDHMANERTFLAWLRTSLSLVTIGIGIVQLFKLKNIEESDSIAHLGKPIGVGFIVIGIYTLLMGSIRYFRVQSLLVNSFYPVSQWSIASVNLAVLALVFITLVIVLITR